MRTIRTDRARQRFLALLAKTANVTQACCGAHISRRAAYNWRAEDPDFAAEWQRAIESAVDALELEAWRRAVEGHNGRPVTYKGRIIAQVREYSDRMLELLLRAHRPDKYAIRRRHEHATQSGDSMRIEIVDVGSGECSPSRGLNGAA